MTYFAVTYRYADDAATLDRVRPQHRAFLQGLYEAAHLVASGPLGDPPGEDDPIDALLVMQADDAQTIQGLLDEDPFAVAGVITGRIIREWNPVIGILAK